MSSSSHQRGFTILSPFPFLSPTSINSFTIPRSYNHSSDDSEAGSPSGGGGGSYGPASHEASPDANYNSQPHSPNDTPFVPRSHTQSAGTDREVALPPDAGNQYDFDFGDAQVFGPTDVYPSRNQQPTQHYPSHPSGGGPGWGTTLRHTGNEGADWRHLPGPSPQDYYRLHTSQGSGHGFTTGAPNTFHAPPAHQGFRGPQSFPSSDSSSGQDSPSPTIAPTALNTSDSANPYEDAGPYLREQLNIPIDRRIDLNVLSDPPRGQRPSQSLNILIKLAIYGSPKRMLTLREIYAALEDRFDFFRQSIDRAWRNSIRHHLSLSKSFRNIPRPITEPGKGKYWVVHMSDGEGYKRERKRNSSKAKLVSDGSDVDSGMDTGIEYEDFSDDGGSIYDDTAPTASTSRKERHPSARRTNTSRGFPYPQPSSQSDIQRSSLPNFVQLSISGSASGHAYPQAASPPTQRMLNQSGLTSYGQHTTTQSSMAPGSRTQTHPPFGQPINMRSTPSRSHTTPATGGISTSPGAYYQGHLASGPQQVFIDPLRRSPTEEAPGYPVQTSGAAPVSYIDPRSTMAAPFDQSQYDPAAGRGRGPKDKGKRRAMD